MTVEATSFLSTSKISNSHEKSAKILKNHKNLLIILLAIVLLLFCILASVLQIYIFKELNKAHEEIEQLKKDVQEIKSNELDRNLLTEISAFNRKYNNQINDAKDQIDLDEKINLIDDKVKFDDVGDDNEEDDEDLDEPLDDADDDNYEGFHSGFGDEEYDDDYDLDSLEDSDDLNEPEKDDDNNIYKDMNKLIRKTRSVTGITEQGVPIMDEPYALRRNRTKLADLNRDKSPRLKLTWNGNHRTVYGQHRGSDHERHRHHHHGNNHVRQHHQQINNMDHSNRFAFAAAPVHHIKSYGQKLNESTPMPIQTRQSRVMHFEDKTKAFRQVVNKDQLAKLKEQRLPPVEHVHLMNGGGGRRRTHQNMPLRKNLEMKNAKRMKITAVHFDGDTTNLERTNDHRYRGNGKVELNKNEYMHWKSADWVNGHGMDRFFHMDSTGTLTVNDHGLFLIYAQVYYSDNHDLNGYEIVHNNHVKYQCTTMTHTGSHGEPKTNSCYTSGLIHLRNGDKIRLRDVGNHRYVLMQPNKSFFGLIKINLLPSIPSGDSNTSSSTDIEQFK